MEHIPLQTSATKSISSKPMEAVPSTANEQDVKNSLGPAVKPKYQIPTQATPIGTSTSTATATATATTSATTTATAAATASKARDARMVGAEGKDVEKEKKKPQEMESGKAAGGSGEHQERFHIKDLSPKKLMTTKATSKGLTSTTTTLIGQSKDKSKDKSSPARSDASREETQKVTSL